jgi:hypothetical protein
MDPYTRKHLTKLRALKQEIEAILANLQQQQQVLLTFEAARAKRNTKPDETKTVYVPTDGWSAQGPLLERCLFQVGLQMGDFNEIVRRASTIESWVSSTAPALSDLSKLTQCIESSSS